MKLITPFLLMLILTSCSKTAVVIPSPTMALLSAPASNATCTSGTVLSQTTSSVIFQWAAAQNTDSYTVSLKNLLTSATTTAISSTNSVAITLLRNTPYSWFVISTSKNTALTATSATWKFYSSGTGVVSYPPFPAALTSPVFGVNVNATAGQISLSWSGSSVTNDVSSYDVYLGTTTPVLLKSGISNSTLSNVQVVSGTTYYWKIISHDAAGNTSDSGISQFSVN